MKIILGRAEKKMFLSARYLGPAPRPLIFMDIKKVMLTTAQSPML